MSEREIEEHPDNCAAYLMSYLEARGAVFTITPEGHMFADLDAIPHFGKVSPEVMIGAVMGFAEEIKRIIRARRTTH
jgi:hypothetical protein